MHNDRPINSNQTFHYNIVIITFKDLLKIISKSNVILEEKMTINSILMHLVMCSFMGVRLNVELDKGFTLIAFDSLRVYQQKNISITARISVDQSVAALSLLSGDTLQAKGSRLINDYIDNEFRQHLMAMLPKSEDE